MNGGADSAFWAALEAEPDAPWHIDAKDADSAPEEARQAKFLADCKRLAPRLIVFAVPNAARRSQWAAAKAKREGMIAGALDIVIAWPGGIAFAEFKNGRDMPSANQRDMLNRLHRAGHLCGVFRTSTGLLSWMAGHGAPIDQARHHARAHTREGGGNNVARFGPSATSGSEFQNEL